MHNMGSSSPAMASSNSSSSTSLQLPLINLSGLHPAGSDAWNDAREQVRHALETYGCFEALYPDIPSEVRLAFFDGVKQLFTLPTETKLRNTSSTPSYGYKGLFSGIPLYESLGITDPMVPAAEEEFSNLMWPQGNATFCESVCSFSKKLSELDILVRRMVLESYGLEKHYDSHVESTNYLLRVNMYKAAESEEGTIGLTPHTDTTIVTLLCQNEVDGLEIRTKGSQWLRTLPSPDRFTIIAGDSFMAWTNGRIHSPTHRVMMRMKEARYSAALFSAPKAGIMVEAPAEMVDEEHPLLFKPFDAIEYLRFKLEMYGEDDKCSLKGYCGV